MFGLLKYAPASALVANVGRGSSGFHAHTSASAPPKSARPRIAKPYWMRVTPSPAREPSFAACVVWRRYVRRKPTNWNEIETSMFQRKEKREPVGSESMITSPGVFDAEGAWIVVSQ